MIEISVSHIDDREKFVNEYTQLHRRAGEVSFFQSPSWIKAWLQIAPQGPLRSVIAKHRGECILMGAVSAPARHPPALGLRETWFQETGDRAIDAIYAEYVDFLCCEKVTHEIRREAISALISSINADGYVFRNLQRKMSAAVFSAAAIGQLNCRVLNEQSTYRCELGGDAYLERLSKSLKSKISRAIRLYGERGALRANVVKAGAAWDNAWEQLTGLHKSGWEARGGRSVFDNPKLVAFHEYLRRYAPDAVHLFEVTSGGETIAVLYNFVHGKEVLNYQSGFKFEDDNRLTPGFVAHAMAAQHYQDAGFEVYDLLAGDADYKARLGEAGETLTSLVIERQNWRNRLRSTFRA